MKRGDILELGVDAVAFEGKSVARQEGFVVFVRGGVPGDTVRARVVVAKRTFAEADVVEVLRASPLRTAPRCRHFGPCGGCRWQHVTYEAQLGFKRQHVIDALERIGGFAGLTVEPTLGMNEPFYYRNKMEFSFGNRWLTAAEMAAAGDGEGLRGPETPFALGLHIAGRYDRVLDVHECWLQSETSARIVNDVRLFCMENGLPVYSTETEEGYLRNLVIREGKRTGDRMVNLVTRDDRPEIMQRLTARLRANFSGISTIVNNITRRKSQVAFGDSERVYHGSGTITERIGTRTYRISANSFFQTNTGQAEVLYDAARRMAGIGSDDVVYDLYSGTGTIALHVADRARAVIGIESIDHAVHDAKINAELNGVNNCTFLTGDLKDTLGSSSQSGSGHPRPDVVITDPPRAGMHGKVVKDLRTLHPRRIVYVSCNPATQARDLKLLCEGGMYAIEEIQPIDMFPHTYHVENVVSLAAVLR